MFFPSLCAFSPGSLVPHTSQKHGSRWTGSILPVGVYVIVYPIQTWLPDWVGLIIVVNSQFLPPKNSNYFTWNVSTMITSNGNYHLHNFKLDYVTSMHSFGATIQTKAVMEGKGTQSGNTASKVYLYFLFLIRVKFFLKMNEWTWCICPSVLTTECISNIELNNCGLLFYN